MTGMRSPLSKALTILAGGPDEEINPETRILVSITTRTLPSYRVHFSGDVAWRERGKRAGAFAQFPHHADEALAYGFTGRRFNDDHIGAPPDRNRLAPSFEPCRWNHQPTLCAPYGTHCGHTFLLVEGSIAYVSMTEKKPGFLVSAKPSPFPAALQYLPVTYLAGYFK